MTIEEERVDGVTSAEPQVTSDLSAPTLSRLSPTALERRVKRWLLTGPFECYLPVTPGLEGVLVQELLDLGFAPEASLVRGEHGGVSLTLDHAEVMRANLCLRTASRVLLRLGSFPASSPEMLYDRTRKLDWLVHLGFATGYRLRVSSRRSQLQAGDQVINTVASAVGRHMRDHGLYPKPDDEAPLEFHVRLLDDRCTISLDTSGEHLHRRGVRTHVHTAPLRETVAAAMALTALRGYDVPDVIVDPFCGSGTLLIEATDVLIGAAPGRHRKFAFQHAAWHRLGKWREVQRRVAADQRTSWPIPRMIGIDSYAAALEAARTNVTGEDYSHIELVHADSTTYHFAALGANYRFRLVIGNAPFGVRLGHRTSAMRLLTQFLDNLASAGGRWQVCLLVHDPAPVTEHPAVHGSRVKKVRAGGLIATVVTAAVGNALTTDDKPD